ncbi:MAG: alpha/beta hydrolase [Bdellovibrionales bacterium]|nr:alpha/beta hydrolase [Bdellovibrionales bacterium]
MREEVVRIGEVSPMVGVLTLGSQSAQAPCGIMFNAGVLHRVGPFRMWVDLARELATFKIPSLRFDLHGLGDSAMDAGESDATQRAVNDLSEALDWVEGRLGKRDFIVFGLCSGADQAHALARKDPRVRGIVFIDGFGYRTWKFRFHRILARVFSFRRLKQIVVRFLRREKNSVAAFANDDVRPFPKLEEAQNDILSFLEQGRRLFYIFTAGVPEYYEYRGQFWDMYPKLRRSRFVNTEQLIYSYYEKSDHTFALVREREDVIRRLVRFVQGRSPL